MSSPDQADHPILSTVHGISDVSVMWHQEACSIHSFHGQIAGGQGTVALELLSQLTPEQLQTIYVPVGGGGLIAGTCTCPCADSLHAADMTLDAWIRVIRIHDH